MVNKYPLLSESNQKTIFDALHYMKMAELKACCLMLALPSNGKKNELIKRIMAFIQKGIITNITQYPAAALARNYPKQPLAPDALMLYGAYKNDAQTRAFFKQLIGPHFHYTAFGIDWLNDRWYQGNPPTYQEFAHYWQTETAQRKIKKVQPKQEWALINFLQRMSKSHPHLSQVELMHQWRELRAEKASTAKKIIEQLIK